MLRRLYNWTMQLAGHSHAYWALFFVSFIESSFFPIPPDVLMIPMIMAAPSRWWRIALVAIAGSVLGGIFGYWIGATLMHSLGGSILAFYGMEDEYARLVAKFDEWGGWAVLIGAVTPFPYKVITIFSGAVEFSLPTFILISVIGRSLRFFIVAGLLWYFGAPMRDFIERRLGLVASAFCAVLLGGFMAIRYL